MYFQISQLFTSTLPPHLFLFLKKVMELNQNKQNFWPLHGNFKHVLQHSETSFVHNHVRDPFANISVSWNDVLQELS